MTVLADVTRVCRRPGMGAVWQCFWCWAHIKKGERYHEQRYVEGGSISTVRSHPECSEAHRRSDRDLEEPINERQPRGLTADEWTIINCLYLDGHSIVSCIKQVRKEFSVDLGAAKRLVSYHPCYAAKSADLHEKIVKALALEDV